MGIGKNKDLQSTFASVNAYNSIAGIIAGILTGGKKVDKISKNFSVDEVKKFAQSPAGQQLMAMLQRSDSEAVRQAQAGNYEDAMKRLSGFLQTPEAQRLLKDLGR